MTFWLRRGAAFRIGVGLRDFGRDDGYLGVGEEDKDKSDDGFCITLYGSAKANTSCPAVTAKYCLPLIPYDIGRCMHRLSQLEAHSRLPVWASSISNPCHHCRRPQVRSPSTSRLPSHSPVRSW